MVGLRVSVQITSNKLPALAAAYPQRAGREVRTALFNIEAGAKTRCPVDTGALRASIAGALTGEAEGEVTVGQDYGVYQEFGTRFQPGTPFMTPAAEAERAPFQARVASALNEV
jgi:HK97 gp10 family phage protein